MSKTKVIIPPAKALLKGLRAIGYSFSTAVADIIDNSISAEAKNIYINFDPDDDEPYFLIFDDGYGMNAKELENAMLFGSNRDQKLDCEEELGRFGLGLKSASLSQCRKFVVISKKFGNINGMSFDMDVVERTNSWELQILDDKEIHTFPCVDELEKLKSGTIVIWNKFDKIEIESGDDFDRTFRSIVSEMKKHIEYVFHRFSSTVNIYIYKKLIEKRDPFLESSLKSQHGRSIIIDIDGCSRPIIVTPHTLPFANSLTPEEKTLLGNPKSIYDEQGFYIYRNKRLIYWGSWMHMGYKSELNKLARIQVDIPSDLDEMWMLDVKKSTAKIPSFIKEKIRACVNESTHKSEKALRYRGKNETNSECLVWNRIKDRDGFVFYEINRDNPFLKTLSANIGRNENKLLNILLNQIECFLPKYRLQNDNADSVNVKNSFDDVEEETLIEDVKKFLCFFPVAQREYQLNLILGMEGYKHICKRKDEILRSLTDDRECENNL